MAFDDILDGLESGETGQPVATDRIFVLFHQELQRVAGCLMAGDSVGATLDPTRLVHEAYLRLRTDTRLTWEQRGVILGMTERTVRSDWRRAKQWLAADLLDVAGIQ